MSDAWTVDSWNTHQTVPLIYNESTKRYSCPKHPSGPTFDSPDAYCENCEADFQAQRSRLQEKQASVRQQLNALPQQSLAELHTALQQWKPPTSNNGTNGNNGSNSTANMNGSNNGNHNPPNMHMNGSNNGNANSEQLPPRHPQHSAGQQPPSMSHPQQQEQAPLQQPSPQQQPPLQPQRPSYESSPHVPPPQQPPSLPSSHHYNNTNAALAPSSLDALTMQLQRMQHMQDWMLLQKEQETQNLKQELEAARQQIQELRVENALLTEKLSQQEERMQQELKLIKMAAWQQQQQQQQQSNGGSNSINHSSLPPSVVSTPMPQQQQQPSAPKQQNQQPQQQQQQKPNIIPEWPPFPQPSNNNSHTRPLQPPPSSSVHKTGRKTRNLVTSPRSKPFFPATATLTTSTPTTPVLSAQNVSSVQAAVAKFNNSKPAPSYQQPQQAPASVVTPSDRRTSLETVATVESNRTMATRPDMNLPTAAAAVHNNSSSSTNTANRPLEISVPPEVMASTQQHKGPSEQAPLNHRRTPSPSNVSDFGMEDAMETWSFKGGRSINSRSPPAEEINSVLEEVEDDDKSEATQQSQKEIVVEPPRMAPIPPKQRTAVSPAVSFPDDNASQGHTVASSTFGEDRQTVVNKSILDPYGDRGFYTGVILRSTGMPHGAGKMLYQEDQRTYDGEWRHGRWHGFGQATFANGDEYRGEYRFDQRHGHGKYSWNDGRMYDGMFREDKRHGPGTFRWPDGAVYEGEFCNGQREGKGKYTFADGGCYEGSWKDGRYSGYGVCAWEDGRCYKGEWLNGMAHGRGVETFADGTVRHDGLWIEDEPVVN